MRANVISERLKALIRQSGQKQSAIAGKARIDPRHLTRLLKSDRTVRDKTVHALAAALDVEVGVLTGAARMPTALDDASTAQARVEHRHRISRASRNAYELVALRYGIEVRALTELAPLCFAVIAEMSLADRRARLGELRAAYDARAAMRAGLGYLPHRATNDPIAEGIMQTEEQSLSSRDIFGCVLQEAGMEDDQKDAEWWDVCDVTPIEVWLRDKAATLKLDCDVREVTHDDIRFSLEHDLALKIADGEENLRDRILDGSVQLNGMPGLKGIPWAMLTLPPAEARLAWLKEQIEVRPGERDQRRSTADTTGTAGVDINSLEDRQ